jgi:hypothetical protein
LKTLLAVLLLSVAAFCQNAPIPTHTFSISASPIALPGNAGTFVGTDSGAAVNFTPAFDLAFHNILSSDAKLSTFMGGADYACYRCSKWLNDKMPTISGFRLLPSIGGAFGVDRVKDAAGNSFQHYSGEAYGSIAYSFDSGGTYTMAARIGAMRAPGYANGWVPVVSVPFSVHF